MKMIKIKCMVAKPMSSYSRLVVIIDIGAAGQVRLHGEAPAVLVIVVHVRLALFQDGPAEENESQSLNLDRSLLICDQYENISLSLLHYLNFKLFLDLTREVRSYLDERRHIWERLSNANIFQTSMTCCCAQKGDRLDLVSAMQ
jgi:hypothetical protein